MRRVVIIGPAGSGKSTLARQLGDILDVETFHLDQLYWRPGWVPTPDPDWDALLADIVARPAWIMDGNFTASLPARIEAADTVVFLDFRPAVCALAAIRRRLLYPIRRAPGMAAGCPPMFNTQLLRWIWSFRTDHRPYYLELVANAAKPRAVRVLRRRRDVRRFLADVRPGPNA